MTTPFEAAATFLQARTPGIREWPRGRFLLWFDWYWRDGRAAVIYDRGAIVAVAVARAMHRPEDAADPYFHDEGAPLIWVDDIASDHPQGISALLQLAAQRFGERTAFAGHVFRHDGRLRFIPWRTVARLVTLPTATSTHHHHGLAKNPAGSTAA